MTMHQAWFLEGFQCLGDACADTCCKGWGMQLTQDTVDKYKKNAPELLDAITSGEAEHIMKRDPETDYCIKFDKGWCGIHKKYGDEMLGDACHFFPRSTRQIGDATVMTAALSCPDITRRVLFDTKPDKDFIDTSIERLPYSMKNYAVEGLDDERLLAVHQAFLTTALDETITPERALLRIRSVAASLPHLQPDSLAVAVPFYLGQADGRLPEAEAQLANPLNLLNTLNALVQSAKATNRDRLMQTISEMETAMAVTLDNEQLTIHITDQTEQALESLVQHWHASWHNAINSLLRRWLYGQLSLGLFPFSGLGHAAEERITIIAIRFATVRLGLMALYAKEPSPSEDEIVRVVQSLARFMDHLADATTSLALYEQLGWTKEARLRGMLEL